MTFDSLTFARRLKTAGFTEALADANRDMLVPDLATKDDLSREIGSVRTEMAAMEQRLQASIEVLGLRMTIRLGAVIGVAVAILGAILRLHQFAARPFRRAVCLHPAALRRRRSRLPGGWQRLREIGAKRRLAQRLEIDGHTPRSERSAVW